MYVEQEFCDHITDWLFFIVTDAMKHTNLVILPPGIIAEFEIQFMPTAVQFYSCIVKLHIVDNPFETFMVRK